MISFNIKNILILLAIAVLAGCYKDEEEGGVVIIKEIPEVIIDHNLVGTIITDNTTQVQSATVDYGSTSHQLTNKSYFYSEAKGVNKYRQPLTITYNNITYTYQSPYIENETNYNTFVLPSTFINKATTSNENFKQSLNGIEMTFDGSKFRKNGNPVSGNINLSFSAMKYENKGQYPGGLIVQDNDGKLQLLAPSSYFTVASGDIDLFEANIGLGNENIYQYDVIANVFRLSIIGNDGFYKLTRNGLYAIGNHDGYNIGYGKLLHKNEALNGEPFITNNVQLNQSYHTTNKGSFLCYVPQSEKLNVIVSGDCNNAINSFDILSEYQNLQDVEIILEGYKRHVIKGQIKDCDNQPIQKSLLKISFGNQSDQLIKYIDNADFEIEVSNCSEITQISVESEFLDGEERSRILAFEVNDTINLFHIHTCSNLSEEYLSLNINGVDNIMMQGEAVMENGRVRISFTNPSDNSMISFVTSSTRKETYNDEDLNIIIDAKNMGSEGYELQCGTSSSGCGFENFILTEYGETQSEFIRGYYKGRFWMKTFHPFVKAGYKNIEGVFHIRRDF